MEQTYRANNPASAWLDAAGKAYELKSLLDDSIEVVKEYLTKYEELFPDNRIDEYMEKHKYTFNVLFDGKVIMEETFKAKIQDLLKFATETREAAEKHEIRLIILLHSKRVLKDLDDDITYNVNDLRNDCIWDLDYWLRHQDNLAYDFHAWIKDQKGDLLYHYRHVTERFDHFKDVLYDVRHVLNSFDGLQ
jgi:hypothetical protein